MQKLLQTVLQYRTLLCKDVAVSTVHVLAVNTMSDET